MAAKFKFEDGMKRFVRLAKLENGEETLEEAMKLFEEGAKLSARCYEMLDKAEQKVTELEKLPGKEENDHEGDL